MHMCVTREPEQYFGATGAVLAGIVSLLTDMSEIKHCSSAWSVGAQTAEVSSFPELFSSVMLAAE